MAFGGAGLGALVLFCCASLYSDASGGIPRDKYDPECMERIKDELDDGRLGNEVNFEERLAKCYVACVMEKNGVVDKRGDLVDGRGNASEIVKKCGIVAEDACERAFATVTCLINA